MNDINYKIRCRTCTEVAEEDDYHPLSEYFPEFDKKLSDLLLFICRIDDPLGSIRCPTEMCDSCTHRLKDAYKFALQAERVNKEILGGINIESKDFSNSLDSIKEENIEFSEEQISENIYSSNIQDLKLEISNSFDLLTELSMNLPAQRNENFQSKKIEISDSDFDDVDPLIIQSQSINNYNQDLSQRNKSGSGEIVKRKCGNNVDNIVKDYIFQCNKCDKKYKLKNSLANHLKRNHSTTGETNENSTLCTICGKWFYNSRYFLCHMRRHRSEKLYKCDICDKEFVDSTDLRSHIRKHTGEKPYKCNICGRSFRVASNFTVHKRRHSGERPYKCTFCEKGFVDSHRLKVHVRIHTGERPYVCCICNKSFMRSELLSTHYKKTGHKKDEKLK